MGLLDNLKTDKGIQKEGDFLGGYVPFDSGLANFKIKLAFLTQSAKKAVALNLHLETDDKKQLKQQIYITSGEKKGCKTYYKDKEGNKRYLPGFNQADSLTNLMLGKSILSLPTTLKTINLYDPKQKKDVPTKVEMLMDLLGINILCGIIKQIVDVKAFHEGTKTYVSTGKTRIENEINKIFHGDTGLTSTEMEAGLTEPVFRDKWEAKWKDVVVDKSTVPKGKVEPSTKAGTTESGNAAPQTNLFD